MSQNKLQTVITVPAHIPALWQIIKWLLMLSLGVTITSNVFFIILGALVVSLPEPVMNQLIGRSPEEAAILKRNEEVMRKYAILEAKTKENR